ncbi:MAG: transglutaminase family protein [Sporichthyaceae bacterium]|nr:transglutaminase family protein [Sporichthyaceae bacterium]
MTANAAVLPPAQVPSRQELEAADRLTYVLHQRFSYRYETPVRELNHRLVVVPPHQHGSQHRRAHSVSVSAAGARTSTRLDAAGNTVTRLRVPEVPDRVEFVVDAVVEWVGPHSAVALPAAALTDPRLLRPTRLTAADHTIRSRARQLAGSDRLATAERLCAYVHETVRFEAGSTSVATTAAQALAGGRGVCQDAAHVMVAMCRTVGLPARYVSGHLLGEGATHAWVEVIVADPSGAARAVAFDPSIGARTGRNYLTIATGRDYADVAPTSGTYLGVARGVLTATQRVTARLGSP